MVSELQHCDRSFYADIVHLPKRPRKVPVERLFCSGKKELLSSFLKDTDIVFLIVFFISRIFPAPAGVKILDSKPRFREFEKESYLVYKTNESLASSEGGMLNHSVLANVFSLKRLSIYILN